MTEAINPNYEDVQSQAKGLGTEEWKNADRARAGLREYYAQLDADPRLSDLARSEQAWQRYAAVKAQVEADSAKAKERSERSARKCGPGPMASNTNRPGRERGGRGAIADEQMQRDKAQWW
jgi:hypothetical protein